MTDDGSAPSDGIITKVSHSSVEDTVARLIRVMQDKGAKVFSVIDHSGEASAVGLEMPDTKLIIFGSPVAGTPVMQAEPLAALDLPLKVLVWSDPTGVTRISYNSVEYLAARYHLDTELSSRLAAVDAITDAV